MTMKNGEDGAAMKGFSADNVPKDKDENHDEQGRDNKTDRDQDNENEDEPSVSSPTDVTEIEERVQPCKTSHCVSVCIVPHEHEALSVWDTVTRARTELKDPGLFRWPPHINMLYPFLEANLAVDEFEAALDVGDTAEHSIVERLSKAASLVEPFSVDISGFGTFGSSRRGVLWLDPVVADAESEQDKKERQSPLLELQSLLVNAFPTCSEPHKRRGFCPHMTLSHFPSEQEAIDASEVVKPWWPNDLSFRVSEFYVLQRDGDDGQFLRIATVRLGRDNHGDQSGNAMLHDPPLPFVHMPEAEEGWVREERMKLKKRRRRKGRRQSKPPSNKLNE